MKKETINTFEKGMVKDLHPLTTPSNVLTDALNATYITYNGNESILQNDMGNTKIGTAYLDAGYIPVGMKEHGGIVYVAAYNPESGKGQIGSYPSPKQLWESEDWSVNLGSGLYLVNVIFLNSDFYNDYDITTEIVKKELFSYSNGEAREFHPGDKFAIKCNKANTLLGYVNSDVLKVQLAVAKADGSIEIIKTMKDSTFFYDGGDTVREKEYLVFTAPVSGKLLLIVTINTLDSFNLIRKYSMDQNNNIVVSIIGEGTINGNTINTHNYSINTHLDRDNLGLYYKEGNGDYLEGSSIQLNEANYVNGNSSTPATLTVSPCFDYGVVKRMERSVKIDFNKIRHSKDDFHEWRFFVTNDYIKIGWAYEYYDFSDEGIDYIQMDFYEYTEPTNNPPKDTIKIYKDYYSGNFEEFIRFSEHTSILYGHIYIVEISRVKGELKSSITWKMLYVSTYYNKLYNSIYNSESVVNEYTLESPISATLDFTTQYDVKRTALKYYLKTPGILDYITKTYLSNGDFITFEENIIPSQDDSPLQFITKVENTYNCDISIDVDIKVNEDGIIGVPNPKLIEDIKRRLVVNTKSISTDLDWKQSTESHGLPNINDENINNRNLGSLPELNATSLEGEFKSIEITDYRYIQGRVSDVKTSLYKSIGYRPVFLHSMSVEDKNRVAPYWSTDQTRVIVGDKDNMYYDSLLNGDGSTINGTSAGAGVDDTGLDACNRLMNSSYPPTTNIFAAHGGDDASFAVQKGTSAESGFLRRNDINGWWTPGYDGGPEIDNTDNFMVACWKFTDGCSKFTALMTPRTWWPQDNTALYPRLDIMLRCILSQLFIALETTRSKKYITTNERYYRYLSGDTNIKYTFSVGNRQLDSPSNEDIMMSYANENVTLSSYYDNWRNKPGLVNLIPLVNVAVDVNPEVDINLQDLYDMPTLTNYYLGQSYVAPDDSNNYDLSAIMTVNTSKAGDLLNYCLNSDLTSLRDGTFEWKADIPDSYLVKISGEGTTNNNGDAVLFRWDSSATNPLTITILNFKGAFTTKAAYEKWGTLQENNEILAIPAGYVEDIGYAPGRRVGKWSKSGSHNAPDVYTNVLRISNYYIFTK